MIDYLKPKTMRGSTRGQTALEYMVTYSWAILVVLIVAVALWQMGIFSGPSVVPGCGGFSLITPLDSKLSGSALQVIISNEAGARLQINSISADIEGVSCSCDDVKGYASCAAFYADTFRPGRSANMNLSCTQSFTAREYYRANIIIDYNNTVSGVGHRSSGDCWGLVE